MRYIIIMILICVLFASVAGCHEYSQREPFSVDSAIDLLKTFQTVNTSSASINSYALPIGAGLAGLVAVLESLRRVEKGKRQYAEHELNNNNKNHT